MECSKRSPEVIQLLDMHTHFAAGTPGTRVCMSVHCIYNSLGYEDNAWMYYLHILRGSGMVIPI